MLATVVLYICYDYHLVCSYHAGVLALRIYVKFHNQTEFVLGWLTDLVGIHSGFYTMSPKAVWCT